MIPVNCEQGTEEWLAVRLGIPTASEFDSILTSTGKLSTQADEYMYRLAVERITGKGEPFFESEDMKRGSLLEPEARNYYQFENSTEIKKIGFAYKDENKLFGASPDGLVGDDGLVEIKCPKSHTHVKYLLDNKVPTKYFVQTQGQLLVTGRKWVDFISYYPALRPFVVRVERNEEFIAKLEKALLDFCKELDVITEKLRNA